ncbi:cob(I)yrinic acid a,c-diamide adenosyltransferase [Xenorhabdus griffiniae]|uniref:cob(I)yrinic acid a,c-diamide adenosyltransferase n=1 Tax=Xenorhabdus griffiniae TaxID=351672 RepID=UPI0023592CA3|nr:cob(I)yrinic acid a,c-diamide adenosyltransferase [Xenorhabdus griffiniae]MDC9603812.1 cob(I)yrinic acid a,c-diamide adenosyltransferase [Xenorhabdus griffiniae]
MTRDNSQYQKRQQRLKEKIDARIEAAQQERGIVIVFTGNGKGKTTAAFGTVIRAIGHGQRAGVIQFIKGTWESGERNLLIQQGVEFHVMATGFTWETQNRESDTAACQTAWQQAVAMLSDPSLHLVVLDELTYMVSYGYLELTDVLAALKQRPAHQSVIITGRGCHRELLEYADTITEMRPAKHAFNAGIKAQKGIDW